MSIISLFDIEKEEVLKAESFEDYCTRRYQEDWEANKANRVMTTSGIDNFLEKNPEYTRAEVEAKIMADDMFASFFIKDPVQQSCYQKYAEAYLNSIPNIICRTLPASGPNARYVYKGKFCAEKDIPEADRKSVKSIDFDITYKNIHIYASHKHTRKQGGNQNNQWYDLIHFSEHACESTEANTFYVALADGPYYNYTTTDGLSKMDHLNRRANNVYAAMTTTDLRKKLIEFVGDLNA